MASPDLAIGSFTDHGPWVVDPDAMPWRRDVDRLRAQAAGPVAAWLETGHLPPLGRLAQVVGRVGVALAAVGRRRATQGQRGEHARHLAAGCASRSAALGPTYIKLGQIISGGEGLFPDELVAEFKLLRDRVPPEPFDDVRRVVELDLGRSLDDVFVSVRPRRRSRRRRSRRCTRPGCAPAKRSSSRCSGRRSPGSCARTSTRCRGSRRA